MNTRRYKHSCSECGKAKGVLEFYQSDREKLRDGRIGIKDLRCIACKTFRKRLKTLAAPEAEQQKLQRLKRLRLKKVYGLLEDDYKSIIKKQGGGCGLCGAVVADRRSDTLCVDHDHRTGAIRGLLCRTCNIVVGLIESRMQGRTAMFAVKLVEYLNGKVGQMPA